MPSNPRKIILRDNIFETLAKAQIISANHEVGGIGVVEEDGDEINILDIYVCTVETTAGFHMADASTIGPVLYKASQDGYEIEDCNLLWHTHPFGHPSPSGLDLDTIEDLIETGGKWYNIIFGGARNIYGRYDVGPKGQAIAERLSVEWRLTNEQSKNLMESIPEPTTYRKHNKNTFQNSYSQKGSKTYSTGRKGLPGQTQKNDNRGLTNTSKTPTTREEIIAGLEAISLDDADQAVSELQLDLFLLMDENDLGLSDEVLHKLETVSERTCRDIIEIVTRLKMYRDALLSLTRHGV